MLAIKTFPMLKYMLFFSQINYYVFMKMMYFIYQDLLRRKDLNNSSLNDFFWYDVADVAGICFKGFLFILN